MTQIQAIDTQNHHDRTEVEVLLQKIEQRTAIIGVMGLGYVGLPLAVEFAQAGFHVIGFDIDQRYVAQLNDGESRLPDVPAAMLQELVASQQMIFTDDFAQLADIDTVSICVPTPVNKTKTPDLSFIMAAATKIAQHLHRGQLIILESTTYPGTTDEVLLPLFEQTGLHSGRDYFLAFSPERIDPGNRQYHLHNIPKVVSGVDADALRLAQALYATAIARVVPVSTTKTAELVKLLENTFRNVNIALVNEFAQIANLLGIDIWEALDAAATKPFGFMSFQPGPGLGGHCLPVDPLYLVWKLRSLNFQSRLIEVATQINSEMPRFVVEQTAQALNEQGHCLKGAHILILGVAYKRDVGDIRESPALEVIEGLHARHAEVAYIDQFVPDLQVSFAHLHSLAVSAPVLQRADCVIIVTDHTTIDYTYIAAHARLILDTRNAMATIPGDRHIWRLVQPHGD